MSGHHNYHHVYQRPSDLFELVRVKALFKRQNEEDHPDGEDTEGEKGVVSEKNLVHKEGQLDARVCNELFSQPRFAHHVNLEPNKEVPLDPNRLECNMLFLILADLNL